MKLKKRLAVLLTAAMVMGMTIPAGATTLSTNEVPGGGSSTGTGSIEDHLEKEATKIILPTISSDAFNFTVDPERLVQATGGARFTEAGHSIDETTMDKGVFFLISENEAGNKTYSYQTPQFAFENRSSFAIDLTVQVEAQHNVEDTDLALLSENELTGASEAGVYLGLKVGKDNLDTAEATAVKYDAPAKLNVSVNGVEDNFQVSWNGTGYVYEEKGEVSDWSSGVFQVEGQATKGIDITEDTSAPLINVTWSWSKYGAEPATELTGFYNDAGNDYRVNLEAAVDDLSKIKNIKVNNVSVSNGVSLSGSKELLKFEKGALETTLGSKWDTATNLVFTFKTGGKDYTCTIAK